MSAITPQETMLLVQNKLLSEPKTDWSRFAEDATCTLLTNGTMNANHIKLERLKSWNPKIFPLMASEHTAIGSQVISEGEGVKVTTTFGPGYKITELVVEIVKKRLSCQLSH